MDESINCLYMDTFINKHKEDPLVAADKVFNVWRNDITPFIDAWGFDWLCKEFFEAFLDKCRDAGLLKEGLNVRWLVHNCPGLGIYPSFSEDVCQLVIDYSIKHGMGSETLHLREHGTEKYKFFEEIVGNRDLFSWCIFEDVYPNPKDENGYFIPFIKNKDGNIIQWPKNASGSYLKYEEVKLHLSING